MKPLAPLPKLTPISPKLPGSDLSPNVPPANGSPLINLPTPTVTPPPPVTPNPIPPATVPFTTAIPLASGPGVKVLPKLGETATPTPALIPRPIPAARSFGGTRPHTLPQANLQLKTTPKVTRRITKEEEEEAGEEGTPMWMCILLVAASAASFGITLATYLSYR
jgi:hypothetical protein